MREPPDVRGLRPSIVLLTIAGLAFEADRFPGWLLEEPSRRAVEGRNDVAGGKSVRRPCAYNLFGKSISAGLPLYTSHVADILGVCPRMVRVYVRQGRLTATVIGRKLLTFNANQVYCLKAELAIEKELRRAS